MFPGRRRSKAGDEFFWPWLRLWSAHLKPFRWQLLTNLPGSACGHFNFSTISHL